MAGFLNSKERIFDLIVTTEGKRQAIAGKMKAEFYAFSDVNSYYTYEDTYLTGSQDFIARPILEVSNLPQDQVTFEADDAGHLKSREFTPTTTSSPYRVVSGEIFYGPTSSMSSSAEFASTAGELLDNTIEHFNMLYILGSPDLLDTRYDEFIMAPPNMSFAITNNRPISSLDIQTANIDHVESLFADKRLSHVPNFSYLPPTNKKKPHENIGSPLGSFPKVGQREIISYSDLQREIEGYRDYTQTVLFTQTSKHNRVFGQLFEAASGKISKLDVIDFGIFTVDGENIAPSEVQKIEEMDQSVITKHVFFAGRVYLDHNNCSTFVHLFTFIFS